jgi:hypothetical protein
MMRDVCEFENGKLGALGRMQVSGWILIINQNDFLDGQFLMNTSSWTGPRGQILMNTPSWTNY